MTSKSLIQTEYFVVIFQNDMSLNFEVSIKMIENSKISLIKK